MKAVLSTVSTGPWPLKITEDIHMVPFGDIQLYSCESSL